MGAILQWNWCRISNKNGTIDLIFFPFKFKCLFIEQRNNWTANIENGKPFRANDFISIDIDIFTVKY